MDKLVKKQFDISFLFLDPEIGGREDMDHCIEKAFLPSEEDAFTQMLYLIMSENVSPDYQVFFF